MIETNSAIHVTKRIYSSSDSREVGVELSIFENVHLNPNVADLWLLAQGIPDPGAPRVRCTLNAHKFGLVSVEKSL